MREGSSATSLGLAARSPARRLMVLSSVLVPGRRPSRPRAAPRHRRQRSPAATSPPAIQYDGDQNCSPRSAWRISGQQCARARAEELVLCDSTSVESATFGG